MIYYYATILLKTVTPCFWFTRYRLIGLLQGDRDRKREEFIDNRQVSESRQVQRPVGPRRLWALAAQHMAASTREWRRQRILLMSCSVPKPQIL